MSTHTVTKKRKSTDGGVESVKKIKRTKSAEKPAPLKSALKKPVVEKEEMLEVTKPTGNTRALKKSGRTKVLDDETTEQTEKTTVQDQEDGNTELTPDQTAALLAGFSSSEDEASDAESGIPVSSLPKPPSKGLIQKRINQALSAQPNDPDTTPGVIYIGRIPHGFYEPQMKAYFSQFGEMTNLRLARNKKTGAAQHHAFVEFASGSVADIVAKTMDKYLLFGHILQVRRLPREQVSETLFRKKGRLGKKPAPRNRMEGRKLKVGATRDVWERRVEKENERRAKKAEKLKELGYEFEMPVVRNVNEVPMLEHEAMESGNGPVIDAAPMLPDIGQEMPPAPQESAVASTQPEHEAEATVVEKATSKKRQASKRAPGKVVKKVKAQ